MSALNELLERNQAFAKTYEGNMPVLPNLPIFILTCVDPRVDPAHYLGLELGDAYVMRTAGARVSRDVERALGVLSAMAQQASNGSIGQMSLIIIHHTKCGMENLVNPEVQTVLSKKLGVKSSELGSVGIGDHVETIKADIELLRQSSLVPNDLIVSGHIYDVDHGNVEEIVPPAPLADIVID